MDSVSRIRLRQLRSFIKGIRPFGIVEQVVDVRCNVHVFVEVALPL